MAVVLFVGQLPVESLPFMSLSAMAKKFGHQCYLHLGSKRGLLRAIATLHPDVIAFSCTTPQHVWMSALVSYLRAHGYNGLIVVGGPHPTLYPEIIRDLDVNVLCVGEGDWAFAELLNSVDEGKPYATIPNLVVRQDGHFESNEPRPLIESLDELPFPDRSLFDAYEWIQNHPIRSFMTSRGCTFNCRFCTNSILRRLYAGKGTFARQRSPEHVVDEICWVRRCHECQVVRFEDDCLVQDSEWFDAFLTLYSRRVGLPFEILARFDQLLEQDIVRMLAQAGCSLVSLGLETGDETLRASVLGKNISNDQIITTCTWLRKYGIRFRTFNMLGIPDETPSAAKLTIALNQELRPESVWSSLFQPYRGLPLTRYAIDRGVLHEYDTVDFNAFRDFRRSLLRGDQAAYLATLQQVFAWLVYCPWTLSWIEWLILSRFPFPFGFVHDLSMLVTDMRMSQERNAGKVITRALRYWSQIYQSGGL